MEAFLRFFVALNLRGLIVMGLLGEEGPVETERVDERRGANGGMYRRPMVVVKAICEVVKCRMAGRKCQCDGRTRNRWQNQEAVFLNNDVKEQESQS